MNSRTFTIGDSFTMATLPFPYPDARLAEQILVEKDTIKGIWVSGEESRKIYENVLIQNIDTPQDKVIEEQEEKKE